MKITLHVRGSSAPSFIVEQIDPHTRLYSLLEILANQFPAITHYQDTCSFQQHPQNLTIRELDATLYEVFHGEGEKLLLASIDPRNTNAETLLTKEVIEQHKQALQATQLNTPTPPGLCARPIPFSTVQKNAFEQFCDYQKDIKGIISDYYLGGAGEEMDGSSYVAENGCERYLVVDAAIPVPSASEHKGSALQGDVFSTMVATFLKTYFVLEKNNPYITVSYPNTLRKSRRGEVQNLFSNYEAAQASCRAGLLEENAVHRYELILHLNATNQVYGIYARPKPRTEYMRNQLANTPGPYYQDGISYFIDCSRLRHSNLRPDKGYHYLTEGRYYTGFFSYVMLGLHLELPLNPPLHAAQSPNAIAHIYFLACHSNNKIPLTTSGIVNEIHHQIRAYRSSRGKKLLGPMAATLLIMLNIDSSAIDGSWTTQKIRKELVRALRFKQAQLELTPDLPKNNLIEIPSPLATASPSTRLRILSGLAATAGALTLLLALVTAVNVATLGGAAMVTLSAVALLAGGLGVFTLRDRPTAPYTPMPPRAIMFA